MTNDHSNNITSQIRNALDRGVPAQVIMLELTEKYQTSVQVLQKLFLIYMDNLLFRNQPPQRKLTDDKLLAAAGQVLNGKTYKDVAHNFEVAYDTLWVYLNTDVWSVHKSSVRMVGHDAPLPSSYFDYMLNNCGFASYHALGEACRVQPVYLALKDRKYLTEADWKDFHRHVAQFHSSIIPEKIRINIGRRSKDRHGIKADLKLLSETRASRSKKVPGAITAKFLSAAL